MCTHFARDFDNIILSHLWWAQGSLPILPGECAKANFSLVYLFPDGRDELLEQRITESFEENGLSRFFDKIHFEFAELDPEKSHYIRDPLAPPPNEFGLKSGPNYLFFHMIEKVAPGYDCLMQMETDCVAIRSGWLNRFSEIEQSNPESWVIGSRYHGPKLPAPWTDHLNGNAIYRSGNLEFQRFFSSVWKRRVESVVKYQRPELAFDCAWVEYVNEVNRSGNDFVTIEQHGRRFQAHEMIANMTSGIAYPLRIHSLKELKSQFIKTFIIHGSWLLPEIRKLSGVVAKTEDPVTKEKHRATVLSATPSSTIGNWIWIKGFVTSKEAWFENGEFTLPSKNSYLSWRIDPSVLPTLHLTMTDQVDCKLVVEIFADRKSRLRRARRHIEKFYFFGLPGTLLILAALQRILRIPRSFRYHPIFLRKKLSNWKFKAGKHLLDLRSVSPPPHKDISIRIRNGGRVAVHGKMDFTIEQKAQGDHRVGKASEKSR